MKEARKRIAGNIDITESGCWEWNGRPRENGYCRSTYKRVNWYIHRLSYVAFLGFIPDGYDVCHKCDNRKCCNPAHLFIGTRLDNMRDAVKKGRQAKGEKLSIKKMGENSVLAKLTSDDVINIRKLHFDGIKTIEIAKKFNITADNIRRIVRRDTWRNI